MKVRRLAGSAAAALSATLTAALGVFALRRVAFLAAAGIPAPRCDCDPAAVAAAAQTPPSVSLVMAARDEAAVLDRTLSALAKLEPRGLSGVLVSDGSRDATAAIMRAWASGRPGWTVVELDHHAGKGAALNAGIARAPGSDHIAFCDADVRPAPDCLVLLQRVLVADPGVGAASGLLWPVNSGQSAVSRYCALELWQHQLITSAAKDRLRLNPPVHGWLSCYRRDALEQAGGFPCDSLGEDVELTNAVARRGWRTRFVAGARVDGEVPRTVPAYWRQHVRWSRALHGAAPRGAAPRAQSPAQRVEACLHAAGYADRVLLLAAIAMAARGRLPKRVPAAYLGLTGAEALSALVHAAGIGAVPRYMAAATAMLPVDAAAALTGSLMQLTRRRRRWDDSVRLGQPVRMRSRDAERPAQCSHVAR